MAIGSCRRAGLGLVVVLASVVFRVNTKDGTIVLENVPDNAVVEVDGVRMTVTPKVGEPVKIEVQTGKHVLKVKRGNDVLLGKSVVVESGKSLSLSVHLDAQDARAKRCPSPAI